MDLDALDFEGSGPHSHTRGVEGFLNMKWALPSSDLPSGYPQRALHGNPTCMGLEIRNTQVPCFSVLLLSE